MLPAAVLPATSGKDLCFLLCVIFSLQTSLVTEKESISAVCCAAVPSGNLWAWNRVCLVAGRREGGQREGPLSQEQGRLQRRLPTCRSVDDVLQVVREHGPSVFHARLVSAAFKNVVRTASRRRADLKVLRQRDDFRLLLALATQQAHLMGGQQLSVVAWALAELHCRDRAVLAAVESECPPPPPRPGPHFPPPASCL